MLNETAVRWIMVVSGVLTCTMLYAAFAPHAVLLRNFGTTFTGPAVEVVVRNWGVLITLTGLMVIYGAYRPAVRSLALVVSGAGKLVFIFLVLWFGRETLGGPLGIAVAVDSVIVVLYALCLASKRTVG